MKKNKFIKDFDYLIRILKPEFIEVNSCVFFKGHFSLRNFEKNWRDEARFNKEKVERTINHVHFSDLTDNLEFQWELARVIKEKWTAYLKKKFPNRKIKIRIKEHEINNGNIELLLDLFTY